MMATRRCFLLIAAIDQLRRLYGEWHARRYAEPVDLMVDIEQAGWSPRKRTYR